MNERFGLGAARRAFLAAAALLASQLPWAAAAAQPSAAVTATRREAATLEAATPLAKPADADGFLRRWLLLEPIAVAGQLNETAVREVVAQPYFPDQLAAVPRDGAQVTVGAEPLSWHALDTRNYNVNLYHFAYALGRPTSNVLFWAVTVVDAPREMRDVRLAIGSNAASVWWVNGVEVTSLYNDRQSVIDDGVSKRITLKQGRNVIRAAIVNGGGATDFCARFLDAKGEPIRELVVDIAP